jgi:Zn-dependent protease with chaperone function
MTELHRRVERAVAAVRGRLPPLLASRLAAIDVILVDRPSVYEQVEPRDIFASYFPRWTRIELYEPRLRGLSDRHLEALLAHEFGHAADHLEELRLTEAGADRRVKDWNFRVEDLPT